MIAVSSWRTKNEVICVTGALRRGRVYCWNRFGRRAVIFEIRDCGFVRGGVGEEEEERHLRLRRGNFVEALRGAELLH